MSRAKLPLVCGLALAALTLAAAPTALAKVGDCQDQGAGNGRYTDAGTCKTVGPGGVGRYALVECRKVPAGKGKFSDKDCTMADNKGSWVEAVCRLEAQGRNHYPDSTCTKKTGGKYVLVGPAKTLVMFPAFAKTGEPLLANDSFTATGGAYNLVPSFTATVKCTSMSASGEATPESEVKKVVIKFKGCTSLFVACTTSGASSGEIVTKSLYGDLVYVKASETTPVGETLEPESGTTVSEFSCAGMASSVTGCDIGEALPLNTESSIGELVDSQSGGKQKWTQVEEQAENTCHLSATFGESSGEAALEGKATIAFSSALEVSA